MGASRPINASEVRECSARNIAFIELPVAFDSLSVVVNRRNSFVDCVTVDELRRMWEPAAQDRVTRWNQIRPGFPDQPFTLVGPGNESGTFDYFTLAVVGREGSSRADYTKSDDDDLLARRVGEDPNALGFFGYGYYAAHKDLVRPLSVDAGAGCIQPSPDSVVEKQYQPLSRPFFCTSAAPQRAGTK